MFQFFFFVYKYRSLFLLNSYLLGLLAKIKCSICSYQLNLWYEDHVFSSRLTLFLCKGPWWLFTVYLSPPWPLYCSTSGSRDPHHLKNKERKFTYSIMHGVNVSHACRHTTNTGINSKIYRYCIRYHALYQPINTPGNTNHNLKSTPTNPLHHNYNYSTSKKHTTLTIPVWSPTTVLGKPNPA